MKKTTMALIGMFFLSLIAITALMYAVDSFEIGSVKKDTVEIPAGCSDSGLPHFSKVVVVYNSQVSPNHVVHMEVMEDGDDRCPELRLKVDPSLTAPIVSMNPEWNKYVTLKVEDDTLYAVFDFHGVQRYPGEKETDKRFYTTAFIPAPITIKMPQGSLKEVMPDTDVTTIIDGLESRRLDYDFTSRINLERCRIDTVSVYSSIEPDSILKIAVPGYDKTFEKHSLYWNDNRIALTACAINTFILNPSTGDVYIRGEMHDIADKNLVRKLIASDVSLRENQGFDLHLYNSGIEEIVWDPVIGNEFALHTWGPMKIERQTAADAETEIADEIIVEEDTMQE